MARSRRSAWAWRRGWWAHDPVWPTALVGSHWGVAPVQSMMMATIFMNVYDSVSLTIMQCLWADVDICN